VKITKSKLRQIIKEEIQENIRRTLRENWLATKWANDHYTITISNILDHIGDETHNLPVSYLENKFKDNLDIITKDEERVMRSNLSYPIIIVKKGGDLSYVLDGNHRLMKSIMTGKKFIKSKILDLDDPDTPIEFKEVL
jgi:hypothetical protein